MMTENHKVKWHIDILEGIAFLHFLFGYQYRGERRMQGMLTREDLLAIEGILAPRFDTIDKQFLEVRLRLDAHDKRFDKLEQRLDEHDKRFDKLEQCLGGLEQRLDGLEQRLDEHDKRFDGFERRFEGLELRMEHLESDVSALRYGQLDLRREIKINYKKIKETYDLALENFGQIEESKTRLNLLEQ